MEQEKINWTKDIIVQLRQKGIGDKKKLDEISDLLNNNFEISEKDSSYLKKHFEILNKLKTEKMSKICCRCEKTLGFLKGKPERYWGYEGKICVDCVSYIKKNSIMHEGKYIEGTLDYDSNKDIVLHLNNFDECSIVISTKDKVKRFLVNDMEDFHLVEKEKNSLKKKIMTAGFKDTITSEFLEIKFHDKSISGQRIVLKIKDLDKVIPQIFSLKKSSEDRASQELQSTDNKTEEIHEENINLKYGRIIKTTLSAQYYGGHKAYLAGGAFGDAQNGSLILTEKYLIFHKNAMRESKKWKIVIPLDKVIIGDWKIDEKIRRKTVAGGGTGIGFGFFGGGTIHDAGKSHDIVVPYVDENGIEQAPRFGVSSITGNAIREWAKIIYDVLVNIQKEKKPETESVEVKNTDEDPLKVLKLRLAKGEITKEEFEELKELIG